MTKEEIKNTISDITGFPEVWSFEVYVVTKSVPRLKKMGFVENDSNNLRKVLKDSIVRVLTDRYASPEAEFAPVDCVADNQDKFYVIPQSKEYDPFE